jgi:hypothetical protein
LAVRSRFLIFASPSPPKVGRSDPDRPESHVGVQVALRWVGRSDVSDSKTIAALRAAEGRSRGPDCTETQNDRFRRAHMDATPWVTAQILVRKLARSVPAPLRSRLGSDAGQSGSVGQHGPNLKLGPRFARRVSRSGRSEPLFFSPHYEQRVGRSDPTDSKRPHNGTPGSVGRGRKD